MAESTRPQRFTFSAPLQIQWGSLQVRANVSDISASGLFIRFPSPFWMGAIFSAHLLFDPWLQICCTVCRVDPGRGMGVRITFSSDDDRDRFAKLVMELKEVKPSNDTHIPTTSA